MPAGAQNSQHDGAGHDVGLSEGQRQLARRAATISLACEKMDGESAQGHDIDLDKYGMLTDRLGRCLARLGIKRQADDAGPKPVNKMNAREYRVYKEQQRQKTEPVDAPAV